MDTVVRAIRRGRLTAEVFASREAMGEAAARHVLRRLSELQCCKDDVRMVVGSAPSQDEFFASLVGLSAEYQVDWEGVTVFHMDEYVGLSPDHPQSFRRYQHDHFVSKVQLRAFHGIRGETDDVEAECARIEKLIAEWPIDIVCLGIGENGHLAFNDPHVADFDDPEWVKVVELDDACRQQQVNDGCFPKLEAVPRQAITLTLRVFREAGMLSGVVPTKAKAKAVAAALDGSIGVACPATLCRLHPNVKLFLDTDSASLL